MPSHITVPAAKAASREKHRAQSKEHHWWSPTTTTQQEEGGGQEQGWVAAASGCLLLAGPAEDIHDAGNFMPVCDRSSVSSWGDSLFGWQRRG